MNPDRGTSNWVPDHAVADSVTWLFVPGSRPDRFEKAASAGADEVIVDLEDAVSAVDKAEARAAAAHWLDDDGARAWVRVNGADTDWFADDITELAAAGVRGLVLPKASARALLRLHDTVPADNRTRVLALIETAEGIRDVHEVAADPAVVALAFGSIDFALDVDVAYSAEIVQHARSALVVAARAAGLPGPIDGVCTELRDRAVVATAARCGRSQGFAGKLCIHPFQVDIVAEAWRPDPDEVAWALRIAGALADAGMNLLHDDPAMATVIDGQMVDRPVLLRARRVLRRAKPTRQPSQEVFPHATT